MVSSCNSIKADDKQFLNIVAVSVLKIKSIHAEIIYSFQRMADITLFGCANGNSKEVKFLC
jgi:hypothetical protein